MPMMLKLKIPKQNGGRTTLWLPLFLIWILLLPLFILLFAVLLIAGLIAQIAGYGKSGFLLIPLIFSCLRNLGGLMIDVESKDEKIFIEFV